MFNLCKLYNLERLTKILVFFEAIYALQNIHLQLICTLGYVKCYMYI